jgi:hypothetical protein
LIEPDHHLEAITSRPLLLHAVGKQIEHAGQKIIQVTSSHGKFKKVQLAIKNLSAFFKTLKQSAEQLNLKERMRRVINRAFEKFIKPELNAPQPGYTAIELRKYALKYMFSFPFLEVHRLSIRYFLSKHLPIMSHSN